MTQFLLCPFISTSIHNWACHRESCALLAAKFRPLRH
jgi:hypothetical protein